jgi:hypothetical protein
MNAQKSRVRVEQQKEFTRILHPFRGEKCRIDMKSSTPPIQPCTAL